MSAQLGLFAGPGDTRPAESLSAHETTVRVNADGSRTVVVRLRLTGDAIEEPLHEGPLTYGECSTWEDPCLLRACRHRLDDAIERHSRKDGQHGDFCALRVAESGTERGGSPGLSLRELAHLYDMSAEGVSKEIVDPAVKALHDADLDLELESQYGERGRVHKIKFVTVDDNVTSTEAKALMVPGEVRRGRSVPTIKGRRWKKNAWAKMRTPMVPSHLVPMVMKLDERLLTRLEPSAPIESAQTDIGTMMRAREAQRTARAEREARESEERKAA